MGTNNTVLHGYCKPREYQLNTTFDYKNLNQWKFQDIDRANQQIVKITLFLGREESEVCGTANAPSPNGQHKVFLGSCMEPNDCINNKCIRRGL